MATSVKELHASTPGVCAAPPPETRDYVFQQARVVVRQHHQ